MTRCWSCAVRLEPLGRQRPSSNSVVGDRAAAHVAARGRPAAGASASRPAATRCSRLSRDSRTASRSTPNSAGSMVTQVSQPFERPYGGLRHERRCRAGRRAPTGSVALICAAPRDLVVEPAPAGRGRPPRAGCSGGSCSRPLSARSAATGCRACVARCRARSTTSRRCETSMPPPLVVMILLPLNENAAHSPNAPAGACHTSRRAPSAASSISGTPWRSQIASMRP